MTSIAAAPDRGPFAIFANLGVRTKILLGFGLVLSIMAGLSVVSYRGFAVIDDDIHLVEQRIDVLSLTTEIDRSFVSVRRFAREYALTGDEADFKRAKDEAAATAKLLDKAKTDIKHPERTGKIAEAASSVEGYVKHFDTAHKLKLEAHKLVAETLDPAGGKLRQAGEALSAAADRSGNGAATTSAQAAAIATYQVRLAVNKALGRNDDKPVKDAEESFAGLDKAAQALAALNLGGEAKKALDDMRAAAETYRAAFQRATKIEREVETLIDGDMAKLGNAAAAAFAFVKSSTEKDLDAIQREAAAEILAEERMIVISSAVALALGGFLAFFLGGTISRPVTAMSAAMHKIAAGEADVVIPAKGRKDEIGAMADALSTLAIAVEDAFRLRQMVDEMPINVMTADPNDDFKINYINKTSVNTLRPLQHLLPAKSDELIGKSIDIFHKNPGHQRRILSDPKNLPYRAKIKLGNETLDLSVSAVKDKTGRYVGPMLSWSVVTEQVALAEKVGTVVEAVAKSAGELKATAQSMSATAEETSRQSTAVAAASEQASTNVQTVASASEELSASIAEISRQVSNSAKIASKAVEDAGKTNASVQGLATAAEKIGDVVKLINDIAGQTNLLALNATIEAARAGEAGKGFAVVASEVKSLANQTAKATEEIAQQISAIQGATGEAVSAIKGIGETIAEINEIATTIAAAVEEQGAATKEIARNVQEAAKGTQDVSSNIGSVTQAAGETGTAASQVLGSADTLAGQAQELRGEVDKFLGKKAA